MRSKAWTIAVAVLGIIVGVVFIGQAIGQVIRTAQAKPAEPVASSSSAPSSTAAIAEPKPGAKQPPAGWLELYDKQRAEVEALQAEQERLGITKRIQQVNEWGRRLNVATPEGMLFNPESRHFEPKK